ncbi:MAG: YqhV family protein [Firmicutes bacterium]|nr:YqhV family protein [Bacillota bacterium]
MDEQDALRNMAAIRAVAGSLEIVAAAVMLRLGTVSAALRVNAFLALIGPLFMVAVTAVGLLGIATHLSPVRVLLIAAGVGLILAGTR